MLFACFHAFVTVPHHALTWLWAALSLTMAAFLQFFLAYAVALLAFWLLEISTVVFIIYSFEYYLSGHMFPLDLMPRWFRAVLEWMPFTYELFFPVAVFLEKVQGAALFKGLSIQAGWLLASCLAGRAMWARGHAPVRGLRRLAADTMKRHWEVYKILLRNSLIREMSFKANFLLWLVTELLWFVGQLVFVDVLFLYTDQIGTWSKWEVVLLIGTHQIISQIFQAFSYMNVSNLPELIRTGRLDLMLLLPSGHTVRRVHAPVRPR